MNRTWENFENPTFKLWTQQQEDCHSEDIENIFNKTIGKHFLNLEKDMSIQALGACRRTGRQDQKSNAPQISKQSKTQAREKESKVERKAEALIQAAQSEQMVLERCILGSERSQLRLDYSLPAGLSNIAGQWWHMALNPALREAEEGGSL